ACARPEPALATAPCEPGALDPGQVAVAHRCEHPSRPWPGRRLGDAGRQASPARAVMAVQLSLAPITTLTPHFAHPRPAYRAAGADGIGIWETKLEDDSLERFRASGLAAAAAVPAVPSILPLPLMEGPEDPAERIESICSGIRRLTPFEPECVLFLTGPGD